MGLDAKEVDHLAKGCIYFLGWHVHTLSATQPEPTDRGDLIDCIDRKHLVDEGRLLEPSQKLLNRSCLVVHLLLRILLQVELLFELIELGPELLLVFLDVGAISFEAFDLSDLRLLLSVNLFYFLIELG